MNSEPFTVSINVDDAHIFDFNTSYQTLANVLSVHFQTWRGEDELVDPDDLSAEHYLCRVPGREFEDDEEKWVPWPKKSESPRRIPNSYTGRVPVVRPAGEGRRRARGQLRAPFLDPVTTFPPQGKERIYRYYRPSSARKQRTSLP